MNWQDQNDLGIAPTNRPWYYDMIAYWTKRWQVDSFLQVWRTVSQDVTYTRT